MPRGMFRARRRFASVRMVRRLAAQVKQRTYHNVNVAPRSLAANTTETYALIVAQDSPATTNVADATTVANCENGSYIVPKGLRVKFGASTSDPVAVSFLLWKDGPFGGLTDPTSADDVMAAPTTAAIKSIKENACMHRKFWLQPNAAGPTFSLKIPRRLRILKDGESIKFTITNHEAATDAVEYFLNGRIISIH